MDGNFRLSGAAVGNFRPVTIKLVVGLRDVKLKDGENLPESALLQRFDGANSAASNPLCTQRFNELSHI